MFKIALRNVFRNRRRTLLNLLLIALGTAALVLLRGYTQDTFESIKEEFIEGLWHLQITHRGYWEGKFKGYEYIIPEKTAVWLKEKLRSDDEVVAVASQLRLTGLVGTPERSTSFLAIGIEPGNAPHWTTKVDQGRALNSDDTSKAVISTGLADNLGVGLEDYLVVMTTTVEGVYNAGNLQIVGLQKDQQRYAVVHEAFARRMLRTQGAERIYVKLRSDRATEQKREELQKLLADNGHANLEVKRWVDLAEFYQRVREFLGTLFGFVSFVIFILVFFSVLEALTMAFFERMREIGTIRAIGTKRSQVFAMFLGEGVLLGVIGGLFGLGVGVGVGALINSLGLTYMPPVPGADETIPFRIALALNALLEPFVIALASTLISSLYPSWRAGRIVIAQALRYI